MKYILLVSTLIYCFVKNTESKEDDEQGRIVGGKIADSIRRYPYVTFLKIDCYDPNAKQRFTSACGSAIINQWFYLSAGHCIEVCSPIPKSKIVGISGNINVVDVVEGKHHEITHFKLHEKYNPDTVENDISLFKLKKPLQLGATMSRVSLLRNPPLNEPAVLAGWGLVDREKEEDTDVLKVLPDLEIISSVKCNSILKQRPPNTICARYKKHNPKSDYAAEGDSGSPLVVRGFIQVGLVSYMNDAIDVTVTVYTEVSKFIDWIEKNTGRMKCTNETKLHI